jgi:citrate lyase beta subunit
VFDKVERLKRKSEQHADAPAIRLITQCETALGLLNLRQICEMDCEEVSESLSLSHEAVIFGGDDFAASIGSCFLA